MDNGRQTWRRLDAWMRMETDKEKGLIWVIYHQKDSPVSTLELT